MRKSPPPEPEADTIDTQSLMTITGWSEEHLRNLAERDYMPPPKRGQWLALETLKGLFTYAREKIADKTSPLGAEKLRSETSKADLLAVRVQKERNKLVELRVAEEGWEGLVLSFRERLMAMPAKVTPQILYTKTQPEIEALLIKEVREALEELAKPVAYTDEPVLEVVDTGTTCHPSTAH